MAQMNPNDIATAGVQALQAVIAKLTALQQQSDADPGSIDAAIDALQMQQAALRDQALCATEASDASAQSILAISSAAARLNAETASMQATAADLTSVAKIVTAATSLVGVLAPFI